MSHLKPIAVKLTKVAEKAVKQGHPWVFEKSILKGKESEHENGSLCVIFEDRTNKPFAFGLWDTDSMIRIKIIYLGTHFTLDKDFLKNRLEIALEKRARMLRRVTGFRAVHGENDGFPGLILDVYANVGVLKLYSPIWYPYLKSFVEIATKVFKLGTVVLRTSRNLSKDKEGEYVEGMIFGNKLTDERVKFEEYGVSFYAYPISGHKTGFFLDQRPNRYWVQQHAKGKRILDVFSYVGGFGIHGLKGGAKILTSLDISQQAMDVAKENLQLNGLDTKKWRPIVGDAFAEMDLLIQGKKKFDLVIIDPPSFAKQKSEIVPALKQYERLASLGAKLTAEDGFLILGSCSSRITLDDFKHAHQKAFEKENERWKLEKVTLHDDDHPVSYPESLYLKTIVYKKLLTRR